MDQGEAGRDEDAGLDSVTVPSGAASNFTQAKMTVPIDRTAHTSLRHTNLTRLGLPYCHVAEIKKNRWKGFSMLTIYRYYRFFRLYPSRLRCDIKESSVLINIKTLALFLLLPLTLAANDFEAIRTIIFQAKATTVATSSIHSTTSG